uniref:Venom S1 protease 3 n=2 Tax=Panheteroptera TaxID=33351 RepID=A0A2K8JL97_9HEMI|nr:venom S1 protease 3 [Lethocerus distinctifemur]
MRRTPVALVLLCWAWCHLAAAGDSYYSYISEEIDSSELGLLQGLVRTNCSCGSANKPLGKIVGGSETMVNEYPYMVALGNIFRNKYYQFCGGAIVTPLHVVTAAHCVHEEKNKIFVKAGEHDLESEYESVYTKTYAVSQVIAHERYDPVSVKHDIALLVLDTKMAFNRAVEPICLPVAPIVRSNKYVKVTGWGDLAYEGASATKLRKVWLRIIPLDECSKKLTKAGIDVQRPTQFCTFGWKKDSCQGDSGGPVAIVDPDTNRYTLAGVVSFGYGCASITPGVNTDVYAYLGWIQHHIRSTARDYRTCARL